MAVSRRKFTISHTFMLITITLLSACSPNPQPSPDPDPPIKKTSDIRGTVTLPGAKVENANAGQPIPGQFIVKLRPHLRAQNLNKLHIKGNTLVLAGNIPKWNIALYKAKNSQISTQHSKSILEELKNSPDILTAEPNFIAQSFKTTNDPNYKVQWNLNTINMPKAWDISTGQKVNVAVIDSGIIKHPDLDQNILPGIDMISNTDDEDGGSGDGDARDYDPTDMGDGTQYHGAHVAGIIAATSNNNLGISGVNWGAKIIPVRVLGKNGSGNSYDILQGMAWASGVEIEGLKPNKNPAKVINLSLGIPNEFCNMLYYKVFEDLVKANIIPIVAAGNHNSNLDTSDVLPANCSNVIVVGATDPANKRAFYSNYGKKVDLMAPGGNTGMSMLVDGQAYPTGIYSTVLNKDKKPDYLPQQGTSMAAPHVAGAVALLLGQQPNLTFSQVKAKLKAASQNLGNGCDQPNGCGAGLLNVASLLKGSTVVNPTPKPPRTQKTNIIISAFYQNDDGSIDRNQKISSTAQATTFDIPYHIPNVIKGPYFIQAFQDLNHNGIQNSNEPIGNYGKTVDVDGISPMIRNIDIKLADHISPLTNMTK